MAKPKGCRCPYKCPVHPERVPTVKDGEPVTTTTARASAPKVSDFSGVPEYIAAAASVADQEGRRADPAPQKRKRTASGHKKKEGPTTAQLTDLLAEILVMPAIPAKAILHCDYCAKHFVDEGPRVAKEIAVMSETSEPLRRVLERMHDVMSAITWGTVLTTYIAKPALHHLVPEPMLDAVGPVMGIPPRPQPVHPHTHGPHAPAPTPQGTNGSDPTRVSAASPPA